MTYVFPTTQPRLHTVTRLADVDPWVAFREACEGGGTPPHWTRLGDDPEAWAAPSDAAGGLVLWCADGAVWRVEPPRKNAEEIAEKALADLRDAAGAWRAPDQRNHALEPWAQGVVRSLHPIRHGASWADWDGTYVPRAAYFSSGGRAILLLDPVASGPWLVAVFRCEDAPRRGASEANITRLSDTCVVEVMGKETAP